jgi:sugar phosphate isomerase/epimerase
VRFGISTHLYHDRSLSRDHLVEIAAHGFEAVEVFATRTHFDYHDADAIARLGEWLDDVGLRLHSVHAPIVDGLRDGKWGSAYSNALTNDGARARAVREALVALDIARRIPFGMMVVHLGVPAAQPPAGDNNLDAARRSIEELRAAAAPLGVRLALEVIPNRLSEPAALVRLLEDEIDAADVGICLDYGHALLMGDVVDAVETVSGHLFTTHVHDNGGAADDHLAPFEGSIDWPGVLTATQKIGYDGVLLMELANTSDPRTVLEKAQRARDRFEAILQAES